MALTARGQMRLLISLAEIGEPVPLNLLRAMHPDLDGEDIGRGVVRLAMAGRAELSRHGGVLAAAISPRGNVLLFPVAGVPELRDAAPAAGSDVQRPGPLRGPYSRLPWLRAIGAGLLPAAV